MKEVRTRVTSVVYGGLDGYEVVVRAQTYDDLPGLQNGPRLSVRLVVWGDDADKFSVGDEIVVNLDWLEGKQ